MKICVLDSPKTCLPRLLFLVFLLRFLLHPHSCLAQWQAMLELNEEDGSISASFLSEPERKYEVYWSDSPYGSDMEWQRAAKDIVGNPSGTNVWTDAGDANRAHPSDVRMRFYHVAIQADGDRDGLTDAEEHFIHKTDPQNNDSDSDHLLDGDEVNVHKTDPLDPDSDGGTMNDGDEVGFGFDPKDKSDDTGDADSDGLSNAKEAELHTNPLVADTDEDTLSDGQEVSLKTDPCNADIDADGLDDPAEIQNSTDPNEKFHWENSY